jgi:hypothetical protein
MSPGRITLERNVSSTTYLRSPSARFTSSREPAATICFPETATAVAVGLAASSVWMRFAT